MTSRHPRESLPVPRRHPASYRPTTAKTYVGNDFAVERLSSHIAAVANSPPTFFRPGGYSIVPLPDQISAARWPTSQSTDLPLPKRSRQRFPPIGFSGAQPNPFRCRKTRSAYVDLSDALQRFTVFRRQFGIVWIEMHVSCGRRDLRHLREPLSGGRNASRLSSVFGLAAMPPVYPGRRYPLRVCSYSIRTLCTSRPS
jgi:hypothetical protein